MIGAIIAGYSTLTISFHCDCPISSSFMNVQQLLRSLLHIGQRCAHSSIPQLCMDSWLPCHIPRSLVSVRTRASVPISWCTSTPCSPFPRSSSSPTLRVSSPRWWLSLIGVNLASKLPLLWHPSWVLSWCIYFASPPSSVSSYSTILCSTYNSPVATSVTGNLKDLLLTVMGIWLVYCVLSPLGALIFKDHLSTMSIIGISISFLGAYSYSYLKLKH